MPFQDNNIGPKLKSRARLEAKPSFWNATFLGEVFYSTAPPLTHEVNVGFTGPDVPEAQQLDACGAGVHRIEGLIHALNWFHHSEPFVLSLKEASCL